MSEVFIPDNPPQRSYTCPSCHKGVKCFRVGDSASYLVMDATDEKHEHDCKYKGPVEIKLLGYKPPKKEKAINESQSTPEGGDPGQAGTGGQSTSGS